MCTVIMILKSSPQIAFGHGVKNSNRKKKKKDTALELNDSGPSTVTLSQEERAHEQARHPSAVGVGV